MKQKIKYLLAQLMIQNLTCLINAGNQEEKDIELITLNSIGLILILGIYCFNYSNLSGMLINIGIQILIVVEMELFFVKIESLTSFFTLIFLLNLQESLRNFNKCYKILSHALLFYLSSRLVGQFYGEIRISELILIIIWNPLEHILVYIQKDEVESPKLSPNVSSRVDQQMRYSYDDHKQQNFIEEKVILSDRKVNFTLDEELLNCLPYGLVLIDANFTVLKHNEKLLHYLDIKKQENIVNQLDQLLSNAELNWLKASSKTQKRKPHIVPLRNLKQSSADYVKSTDANTLKPNWISDRNSGNQKIKDSFKSSIQDSSQFSFVQLVMNEFITQSQSKLNFHDHLSINSDQTHMFKFHSILEKQNKKKHFNIKVYEVNIDKSKDVIVSSSRSQQTNVFLFVVENVTNKEELKEMTVRYKFQQALLNSFSHELRTPLNCSLSLLQAVTQKVEELIFTQYLQPAIISCKKLLFQINDILDFAQIECNDFKINSTNFSISEILETMKELFSQECQQKSINLILDGNQGVILNSDKERIIQILVNLTNNSIKFTKQGGRIVISIRKKDSYYEFSVWDSGEGISNEAVAWMNHKQYPLQSSTKLGLGLRVSQGIVKYLGGDGELSIKSEKGTYTSISFCIGDFISKSLSLQDEFLDDIQDSAQKVYTSTKNFLKKCPCIQILIVDDVPFNHIALIALLQNFGYQADSVYDGDSAIRKVKQRQQNPCCKSYRLIFMDIEMPGKNGFVSSREISGFLKAEKLYNQCILIMCSAYNGLENADKAHECGFKEIMSKPIQFQSLQKMLNKYFL